MLGKYKLKLTSRWRWRRLSWSLFHVLLQREPSGLSTTSQNTGITFSGSAWLCHERTPLLSNTQDGRRELVRSITLCHWGNLWNKQPHSGTPVVASYLLIVIQILHHSFSRDQARSRHERLAARAATMDLVQRGGRMEHYYLTWHLRLLRGLCEDSFA